MGQESDASILVEGVVKTYPGGSRNALDGLSFRVREGEMVALLGPNGAGKSTLINILTTAIAPTSGRVELAGIDVVARPEEARRVASFVFQSVHLDLELTIEENARVAAALYGVFPYRLRYKGMPAAYRTRVEGLADTLALTGDLHRPAKQLSGGTQRRAELLRALVVEPRVLLLDEPTVGLDPSTRNGLWRHVTSLRAAARSTILVSTHFLAEAETADRVVIMSRGGVAAEGTPDDLRRRFASTRIRLDATDRLTLRLELERLDLRFTGTGPFEIASSTNEAHAIVQGLRLELTLLEVRTPTLEEAYFSIIREEAT